MRTFCVSFNDTATTEIYTLSLHDALPILIAFAREHDWRLDAERITCPVRIVWGTADRLLPWPSAAVRYRTEWLPHADRSEEHTSELQSRQYLVCRLLLEKKASTFCRWYRG